MDERELGIKVTGDISDIIQALDQLTSQLDGLSDKSLDVDVNVNSDSLDGLNSELENASTNMASVGDASALTAEQINEAMSTSASSIDNVSTESIQAATDLYNIGIEGEGAGTAVAEGMEGAVLAVAALSAGMELAAEDIADINSSIEKMSTMQELTGVGLDEGEYRGIIADITNAKFPTEDAIKYVKVLKTMGVDNDKLDDSATALNKIGLSTGLSADQMLSLSKSLKLVGTDMNNVASAYDAVAYGAAKSMGGVDTYTKYMDRFSYKFGEMGLNADQAAVLIVAASKKYGDSRRGMAEFGKAIDESGGNLDALGEKVGLTNNELSNASTITAQSSGVIQTNSDKVQENATMWQQFMAVVDDVKVRFGDLLASVLSIGAVVGTLVTLPAVVAKVFDKIIPDKNFFQRYITWLWETGGRIQEGFRTVWGKIFGDAGVESATKLIDGLKSKLTNIWDTIKDFFFKGGGGGKGGGGVMGDEAGRVGSATAENFVLKFAGKLATLIPTIVKTTLSGALKLLGSALFAPVLEGLFLPGGLLAEKDPLGALFTRWNEMIATETQRIKDGMGPLKDQLNLPGWIRGHILPLFEGLPGEFYNKASELWNNFTNGINDAIPDLNTSLDNVEGVINDTLEWLSGLPGKAWQWGWDTINSWKEGMGSALDGAKGWLESKLEPITSILEGHSPPKDGPLQDIDTWGRNIGRSFMEGIGEGIGLSSSLLDSALSTVSNSFGVSQFSLPTTTSSALQSSGSTIPVTINLTLPSMSSREEAVNYGRAAGEAAGQSFAEVLRGQATNAGVSTVNMMR